MRRQRGRIRAQNPTRAARIWPAVIWAERATAAQDEETLNGSLARRSAAATSPINSGHLQAWGADVARDPERPDARASPPARTLAGMSSEGRGDGGPAGIVVLFWACRRRATGAAAPSARANQGRRSAASLTHCHAPSPGSSPGPRAATRRNLLSLCVGWPARRRWPLRHSVQHAAARLGALGDPGGPDGLDGR